MKSVKEKFCIACECLLPSGKGLGEVCVKCYQKLKKKPLPVKREMPAKLTVVIPLPCKHGENCRCWSGPMRWGVIYINARRQCMYVGGPFSHREAIAEARKIRSGRMDL